VITLAGDGLTATALNGRAKQRRCQNREKEKKKNSDVARAFKGVSDPTGDARRRARTRWRSSARGNGLEAAQRLASAIPAGGRLPLAPPL
jgi:hypothetical protein